MGEKARMDQSEDDSLLTCHNLFVSLTQKHAWKLYSIIIYAPDYFLAVTIKIPEIVYNLMAGGTPELLFSALIIIQSTLELQLQHVNSWKNY